MNAADRNTKQVTRLKLASLAVTALVTATCLPPVPRALAVVERRTIEACEALQVVYVVATADEPPAGTATGR